MSQTIALLLLVTTLGFSSAHAAPKSIRGVAAAFCHYMLSGTPVGTRASLLDRMVSVPNLPTGFGDSVRARGLARVIEDSGDQLTIEYTNERTMELETMRITSNDVKPATDGETSGHKHELQKAAARANQPDPELKGKTIYYDPTAVGYARIVEATQAKLQVELVDLDSLSTLPLQITRPADLQHPSAREANHFADLLKLTPFLADQPALRDGNYVSWTPNVPLDTYLMMESKYLRQRVFPEAITFGYEPSFTLPDVPAIRVPHYYRHRPIPMRIDRVALDQGVVYVSGATWSGVIELSVDFLSKAHFVEDPFAKFFTLDPRGSEQFADFRTRFGEARLSAGDFVLEFPRQPSEFGLTAPVETASPLAYRVLYADPDLLIVKNPVRTLHLTEARDLARFATSSKTSRQSAAEVFEASYGADSLEADGSFEPTAADVTRRPYFREFRSIRYDLLKAGFEAERIDAYALQITTGQRPTTDDDLDEEQLQALVRRWHPDRPTFAASPSAREFATEVAALANAERTRLKEYKAAADLVHDDSAGDDQQGDQPGTGVALGLPYRRPTQ